MSLSGIHHSSGKDNWGTPPDFFERLQGRFDFQLDVCAEPWSAKCADFYTIADDGLTKPWKTWSWCNPPYSNILGWYKKACWEAERGSSSAVLTFARTDTKAFHEYALRASEIIFLKGRLKFVDPETQKPKNPAPSPSMLVVFDKKCLGAAKFSTLSVNPGGTLL